MSAPSRDRAPAPAPPIAPVAPVAPVGWVVRRDDAPWASNAEPVLIWGLAPEERLLRSLRRSGCSECRVIDAETTPVPERPVLALRGDAVLDERLVAGLRDAPLTCLVHEELGALGGHVDATHAAALCRALGRGQAPEIPELRLASPAELAPDYVAALRKREPAFAFAARPERVAEVERRTFAASYKGLTDLVTRWVWPRPAAVVTGWCARRGVHPNTVTLWSWALAVATVWLFLEGAFGLGLFCAWAMTFLDTVDGKLARVTLTSSRLGDVLDHGLDLIHPPFWWWAWGVGLGAGHDAVTLVVVGGYLLGRILEGAFLASFGFETHSWRPLDGLFRTITARRNPNLILLSVGTAAGRPDLGFLLVALWTLLSLGFHGVRLLQARALQAGGGRVAPWNAA